MNEATYKIYDHQWGRTVIRVGADGLGRRVSGPKMAGPGKLLCSFKDDDVTDERDAAIARAEKAERVTVMLHVHAHGMGQEEGLLVGAAERDRLRDLLDSVYLYCFVGHAFRCCGGNDQGDAHTQDCCLRESLESERKARG